MFIVKPNSWRTFLFMSLLGWFFCIGSTGQAKADEPKDKADEIKTLLKEKCDLLEKAMLILTKQYHDGTIPFTALAQVERDAVRATLDLDEGPEKRLAALKKLQKNAEDTVSIAETNLKLGLTTGADLLQAKALLLEVRIEVLRNKQKAKSSK
jgi:hypothetical protein